MLVRLLLITIALLAITANAISLVSRDEAENELPLGARCTTSDSCLSGYCGKSRCKKPSLIGESCYKSEGCTTNLCDKQTGTCVYQSAEELLHLTQPVAESRQYMQNGPVFLGQATVSRLGRVDVHGEVQRKTGKNTNGARLRATSTEPAVMRTTLDKLLPAEEDTGLFYQFRVEAFQAARKGASCRLSTNFNGKALSLPLLVDGVSEKSEMAAYTLAPDARAHTVSVLLRCDRFASATVMVSEVRIEAWKA